MKTEPKVRDWMRTDVISVEMAQTVGEALQVMIANRLSALPVINAANRCVGVIAAPDILAIVEDWSLEIEQLGRADTANHYWLVEKLTHQGLSEQPVRERMTPEVISIAATASIKEAAEKMVRHRIHHLIVLGKKHEPIGILSSMDLMHALAEIPTAQAVV